MRFFSEGIVVRDVAPHPPFLLLGRSGTVFVPWSMFGEKKPAILGWYLELWRGRDWAELHVARHSFSIIVPNNLVHTEQESNPQAAQETRRKDDP